jgi:hypothetical protein
MITNSKKHTKGNISLALFSTKEGMQNAEGKRGNMLFRA